MGQYNVIYNHNRVGQRVNHKGQWLFLTGFYNEGYWQAQDHDRALVWVKNDTIKPTNTNYKINIGAI